MDAETQANDAKIKLLLTAVETKRAALGNRPKAARETNGTFKWAEDNTSKGSFNIHTIKDVNVFLDALAFLMDRKRLREEAAVQLEVEISPFVWNGYSIDQWKADFKLRISILQYEEGKKDLVKAEKLLKKRMSEVTKTALELEKLEAELLG